MSDEVKCPNCNRPGVPFNAHEDECCAKEDGGELSCLRLTVARMRPVVEAARKMSVAMRMWDRSLTPYGPGRAPNGAEDEAFDCWRLVLDPALDGFDGKAKPPPCTTCNGAGTVTAPSRLDEWFDRIACPACDGKAATP